MKSKITIAISFLFLLLLINPSSAQRIDKNAAWDYALLFAKNSLGIKNPTIDKLLPWPDENNGPLYAVNFRPDGFVLLSANGNYGPLLAYSKHGHFHPDQLPEQAKALINHQMKTASAFADSPVQNMATTSTKLLINAKENLVRQAAVAPLLRTIWGEDFPYNAYCPEDINGPGGHVFAGSSAVAMAQIMYYWRWPLTGQGSKSYTAEPYGVLSADFGATHYLFDAMMPNPDPNYDEIALLLSHIGIASEMHYSPTGSGTDAASLIQAMSAHFRYSDNILVQQRANFSDEDWKNLIKSQLDQDIPVLFGGFDTTKAHTFVCDGYDNQGLFHFNFGYSGYGDGYYLIDDPLGFAAEQACSQNLVPNEEYPAYASGHTLLDFSRGTFSDGSGPLMPTQSNAEASWLISPQTGVDSVKSILLGFHSFQLGAGDTLFVYDGENHEAPLLHYFTGDNVLSGISSSGNKIFVAFKTNSEDNGKGWLAFYESLAPDYCIGGQHHISSESGTVNDGSGTKFNYQNNFECEWIIEPMWGTGITLGFNFFDTEPGKDVLKIFEGKSNVLLGTFSGIYLNGVPQDVFYSRNGILKLQFTTDESITKPGWEVYYMADNVGIQDQTDKTILSIAPVPAQDFIEISLKTGFPKDTQIEIYDALGNPCARHRLPAHHQKLNIDISALNSGIYFLKAGSLQHKTSRRFIKL